MSYKPTGGKAGRPRKGEDSHGNPLPAPMPPPGGNALSAANARRSTHVDQLRRQLDGAERSWQATIANLMSGGADAAMRARLMAQYEEGRQSLLGKIAEAEELSGWDLVEGYAPEWKRPAEPQEEPGRIEESLNRGAYLPRGRVGAAVVEADPGYMAKYQARMSEQEAEAEHQARIKRGQEALALAALND